MFVIAVSRDGNEYYVTANGMELITIYLNDNEGDFIAAQWKQKIRQTNITENNNTHVDYC